MDKDLRIGLLWAGVFVGGIILGVLMCSCATFDSEAYILPGTKPVLSESILDSTGNLADWGQKEIHKSLTVSNPLDRTIYVEVRCRATFPLDFTIPPHTTKRALITSNEARAFDRTCWIRSWSAAVK